MNLGDRMKMYEAISCGARLIPRLPVLVRLDGRCFHAKTRGCDRPFDGALHAAMCQTASALCKEAVARAAYIQSDEISLVLWNPREDSEVYFNGQLFKIQSVLAGLAALEFAKSRPTRVPDGCVFDCRSWNVPTMEEAANCLLWREQDCTRNSLQMAARSVYSHKQCHNKHSGDLHEMLHSKGINWNDYPAWAKRGTYIRRMKVMRELTPEEREKIPAAHRPPEGQKVERAIYKMEQLPKLSVITNRVFTLFDGAKPVLEE